MGRWQDGFLNRAIAVIETVGNALPPRCPVPWRPSALSPVFSGFRDLAPTRFENELLRSFRIDDSAIDLGAPVRMRVWFPSVGGSPQSNEILSPCGQYPLLVFAHGQCFTQGDGGASQRTHYLAWSESRIVRQQARAGYVVVVPQLGGVSPGSDADLNILRRVVDWMRSDWIHAGLVAPPPHTDIIGHSYGAVHAARLAADGGIAAYVSLSGDFNEWDSIDSTARAILASIGQPKLFVNGSEEGWLDMSWEPPVEGATRQAGTWDLLPKPKHQAVIREMSHYDYVLPGLAGCEGDRGPCVLAPDIAADVVTMFLGRYVSPPSVARVSNRIPPTLNVPAAWRAALSLKQSFYSGSYLMGLTAMAHSSQSCRVTLAYDLPLMTGVVTLPIG